MMKKIQPRPLILQSDQIFKASTGINLTQNKNQGELDSSMGMQCTQDDHVENFRKLKAEGLITKKELSRMCRVSLRTIDNWQLHRRIPSIKVGRNVRFRWPAVEAALLRYERRAVC